MVDLEPLSSPVRITARTNYLQLKWKPIFSSVFRKSSKVLVKWSQKFSAASMGQSDIRRHRDPAHSDRNKSCLGTTRLQPIRQLTLRGLVPLGVTLC